MLLTSTTSVAFVRHICVLLTALLLIFGSGGARAQATFSNVTTTVVNGTTGSDGRAGFKGTVKASGFEDTVYKVEIVDGNQVLAEQYFDIVGTLPEGPFENTVRTIDIVTDHPLTAGAHTLKLVAWTKRTDAETSSPTFAITAPAVNNATFVSQSVSAKMMAGQDYDVSVTMKNTGTVTWGQGGTKPHGLGSLNPMDNFTWRKENRVVLPVLSVPPGHAVTFNFTVTAPTKLGIHNFQWGMVHEWVEWFGFPAPNVAVEVIAPVGDPTVTFTSPATDGTYIGSSATIQFVGQAEAGSGGTLKKVELLLNGIPFESTASNTISASKTLEIGSYSIELRATNSADKVANAYRNIIVTNNAPPVPTAAFTSPAEGAAVITSSGKAIVSFSGSVTAGTGATLESVQLLHDGVAFASGASSSINGSKEFSLGTHNVELKVKNSSEQSASVTRSIRVVPPAPTASFSNPTNGSSYSASGSASTISVSAAGTAGNGASVSQMKLFLNGVLHSTYSTGAVNTTLSLATGTHTLGIQAIDSFGTAGQKSEITVTITALSSYAPTATFTSPVEGAKYSATGTAATVSFTGNVSAGSGATLSNVQLIHNGVEFAKGTSSAISGSKLFNVGTHSIELKVTNSQGHVASAIRTITIVPAGPSVSFASPATGSTFAAAGGLATVSINATGIPAAGTNVATMKLYVNGVFHSSTNSATMSSSIVLGVGAHSLGVEAVDDLGTTGTRSSINVSVTGTATSIPIAKFASPKNNDVFILNGSTVNVTFTGVAAPSTGASLVSVELIDAYRGGVIARSSTGNITGTAAFPLGPWPVELRVTDSTGQVASEYVSIIALLPGPTAAFTKPLDGASFQVDGATATIPVSAVAQVAPTATFSNFTLWVDGVRHSTYQDTPMNTVLSLLPGTHILGIEPHASRSAPGVRSDIKINVIGATRTEPLAVFTSPDDGKRYVTTASTQTVSFSGTAAASPGAVLSSVELRANGLVFASGKTESIIASKSLPHGTHNIELRVADSSGKIATATRTVIVSRDPPGVYWRFPDNGTTFVANGATASISASLNTFAPNLQNVKLYVNEALHSTSATVPYTTTLNLPPGTYTLGIDATDTYGLTGERVNIGIYVAPSGSTPPSISMSQPLDYYRVTSVGGSAAVAVQGSATAMSGRTISKIELLVNGAVVNAQSGSNYSGTANLPPGRQGVQLRATDSAGVQNYSALQNVFVTAGKQGDSAAQQYVSIPSYIHAGQPYTFTVEMLNNGTSTWTNEGGFRLGAQSPQDNGNFGGRVALKASTPPGAVGQFQYHFTAPSTPGIYNFQRQMVVGDANWFGAPTQNYSITVAARAAPTVTLSATPTNSRVGSGLKQKVVFSGTGTGLYEPVVQLALLKERSDGLASYSWIKYVTGETGEEMSLDLTHEESLPVGVHTFRLRVTEADGDEFDSRPVVVTITDSELLGSISGVRTQSNGKPELFGWACKAGSTESLSYKVFVDAPTYDSGGMVLTQGVANVSSEADSVSVQTQCATPSVPHHFVVDLSSFVNSHAGRSIYVQAESADKSARIVLPCSDNMCTIPGTTRVAISTPQPGATFVSPSPAFLRMEVSNGGGQYEEVGFYVDGEWLPAKPDGAAGAFSTSKSGLAPREEPYSVYAKVRQGATTVLSTVHKFTVVPSLSVPVTITSPASGATLTSGIAHTLRATVQGTVQTVKFDIDGVALGTAVNEAGEWRLNWTPATGGSPRVRARAYDGAGLLIGESALVTINVTYAPSDATPKPINITIPDYPNDAGTLPGALSSSNDGTAGYSISLPLPPGAGGMTPSLSLNYSSGFSSGIAGLGWSVGGLSSIERCGKTIATDGKMDTVRMSASDRLCLDGMRLVLINGDPNNDAAYWASGAEYRTEQEIFARVKMLFNANGQRYLTVQTKDGIEAEYGNSTDSYVEAIGTSDAYRWRINRRGDRSGNHVSYIYNEDLSTGESTPSEVRWGGNSSVVPKQEHFAKAVFMYETREDARATYVAGSAAKNHLRLASIQTYTRSVADMDTHAHTVALSYQLSPSSKRSLLKSVQICASGNRCLPATTFEYGEPNNSVPGFFKLGGDANGQRTGPNLAALSTAPENPDGGFGDTTSALGTILIGDFNNDGKSDLLERYRVSNNNSQQRLFESNPAGTNWIIKTPFDGITESLVAMESGDFDGDGLTDILVADESGYVQSNWRMCWGKNRNGDRFVCGPVGTIPPEASRPAVATEPPTPARTVKDFNADGKDDLFIRTGDRDDYYYRDPRYLCLSTGSGFNCSNVVNTQSNIYFGPVKNSPRSSGSSYADMDADGRVDLVVLPKCYPEIIPNKPLTWICRSAYSTDQKHSVRVFGETEPGAVELNSYWFELPNERSAVLAPIESGVLTGDFNADGYSDIVLGRVTFKDMTLAFEHVGGHICYSKGSGDADCKTLPTGAGGVNVDHLVLSVGDFDGDGQLDILRPQNDAWLEDNTTGYRLCRVGVSALSTTSAAEHECHDWQGPVFYSVSGLTRYRDGKLKNSDSRSLFGDFNGDGRPDIASYIAADQWTIAAVAERAKPGEALDKLVGVTNGVGHQERVEYALPNDSSVYIPEVSLPNGTLARSGKRAYPTTPLVKAIRQGNGSGGWRETRFNYAAHAVDGTGRGSLGFARIQTVKVDSGITSTEWLYQEFPHVGEVQFAQTIAANGSVLSNTKETRNARYINHSNGRATQLSYVSSSEVTLRDLDNSAIKSVNTSNSLLDDWGNILESTEATTFSGKKYTAGFSRIYDNDSANWFIGKLRRVVESRTSDVPTAARTIDYTYDALGRLKTETRQKAEVDLSLMTTYGYNGFGQVTTTQIDWFDPLLNAPRSRIVSDTSYDSVYRFPRTVKNAIGQTDTLTFDPVTGAKLSNTDANNLLSEWKVDGFGRVYMEKGPDGNEVWTKVKQCTADCPAEAATVTIKQSMRNAGATQTASPVISFSDSAGHVIRVVSWALDGTMVATDTRYDERGRPVLHYWPRHVLGQAWLGSAAGVPEGAVLQKELVYDDLDRVRMTRTLDEGRNLVTSETFYKGLVTTFKNPLGRTTSEHRDGWGRLSKAVDAANYSTIYVHDSFGNLKTVTDPKNNVVEINYDNLGRRKQLKDPDLGIIEYWIDPLGQVYKQESPNQRAETSSTTYGYDSLGRMISRTEKDLNARWIYDVAEGSQTSCASTKTCGKLVESYTLAGTTKDFRQVHTYDLFGRAASVTSFIRGTAYTSNQDYDAWGRPLTERHQRGSDVGRAFDRRYNSFGHLESIERNGLVLWRATATDPSGQLKKAQLGNGLLIEREYNPYTGRLQHGYLKTSDASNRLTEGYQYDPVGNVKTRTQYWPTQGFIESFEYDAMNRLATATVTGRTTQTFNYDEIGNIKDKFGVGTYTYPTTGIRPHAVSSVTGGTMISGGAFTYDANGNLLTAPGRPTWTWSSFDMPKRMTKGSAWADFVYGADRQRIVQTRNDGTTIYAGAIEVHSEGSVTTVKTYWPMGIGVEIEKSGSTQFKWFHKDRLGSVVATSDEVGALGEMMSYDSWGRRRTTSGTDASDALDGIEEHGFTGHEMLDQLDLVHMNGRVFEPTIARFTSADPLIQDPTHSQSYNRYTYVWNNPTNLTDPTGFVAEQENKTKCQTAECNREKQIKQQEKRCNSGGNCRFIRLDSGNSGAASNSADSKTVGRKAANTGTQLAGGTSAGCQTTIDCRGKGNGYDTADPLHHEYKVASGVCNEGTPGCTVQNVNTSVTKNAAPGSDGVTPVKTGDKTGIVFLGVQGGHVTHIVDPANTRVVNITESDHVFHNGIVVRSVVSSGGTVYVLSNGEGVNRPTNNFALNALSKIVNLVTAIPGFSIQDRKIQIDVLSQSSQGQLILQQQQNRRLEAGQK